MVYSRCVPVKGFFVQVNVYRQQSSAGTLGTGCASGPAVLVRDAPGRYAWRQESFCQEEGAVSPPDIQIQIDQVSIAQATFVVRGRGAFRWHVGPVLGKGARMPLEVSLTTEEKVRIAVLPMTAGGQLTTLDARRCFA
jgi:hypothetical protein